MKNLIKDTLKNTQEIIDSADNLYQDAEERDQHLSERHRIDAQSNSWLSRNIRPLTLLFLMTCQFLIILIELFGHQVSEAVIIQVGTLLAGAFGFYFHSRRAEKIATTNAKANIEVEKLKVKHELKEARKQARHERREKRRADI